MEREKKMEREKTMEREKPMVDYFEKKAKDWDSPMKIEMANKFVLEMFKNINFGSNLKVLELGCGTGLVGLQIAPLVKSIVFVDSSAEMMKVLKKKIDGFEAEVNDAKVNDAKFNDAKLNDAKFNDAKLNDAKLNDAKFNDSKIKIKDKLTFINGDIERYTTRDIDILFSLMAIHHIENTQKSFEHISSILKPGGLFVIGDLKEEDGSFHGGEYVPHKGFNVQQIAQQLENSDLEIVTTSIYNTIKKNENEYDQFILISKKSNVAE